MSATTTKRKQIVLQVDSIARAWLELLSGLTELTGREIDVLELLITKRAELVSSGVKKPYLSEILFSTTSRKEYYTRLGISEYNFTNLLGALRKKKALVNDESGEDIYSRLIPADEMVIKFIQTNDRGIQDSEENSGE